MYFGFVFFFNIVLHYKILRPVASVYKVKTVGNASLDSRVSDCNLMSVMNLLCLSLNRFSFCSFQ